MIVIDASVLADALVDDGPVGQAARAALEDDVHWAAPAHLLVEVLSVIRGRALGRKLSTDRARAAVKAVKELAIDTFELRDLVDRIWQLRENLTAYDAAYFALAEQLDCPLLTADRRLRRTRGVTCPIRLVVAGS